MTEIKSKQKIDNIKSTVGYVLSFFYISFCLYWIGEFSVTRPNVISYKESIDTRCDRIQMLLTGLWAIS